jgi:phasin
MNEQFTRQAQDMFRAAQDGKIPETMQAMAEDGVAKTREAFQKVQSATKDNAKVVEDIVLAAHAGAKAIGDKVIENTTANAEAVFDAAQAIARARSIPEAARLQADFMQQQMAIASSQTKELFELSTRVTRQAFESVNAAANRSFEQFKR